MTTSSVVGLCREVRYKELGISSFGAVEFATTASQSWRTMFPLSQCGRIALVATLAMIQGSSTLRTGKPKEALVVARDERLA
jgi:hypothetical protein